MKLTKAIEAATHGLERLERQYAIDEAAIKVQGNKLSALRREKDAHREMLNAMLKLQDCFGPEDTIEFRIP